MIKNENHIGEIILSKEYLKHLIGKTVTDCFGVVGTNCFGAAQGLRAVFQSSSPDNGVIIRQKDNKLYIDLHICVSYGINLSAISDSIVSKVRFALENEAGVQVAKINLFIDDMKN